MKVRRRTEKCRTEKVELPIFLPHIFLSVFLVVLAEVGLFPVLAQLFVLLGQLLQSFALLGQSLADFGITLRCDHFISQKLFLALSTVKGHNLRIFGKLQAKSRTEAVARARELGLL